MQRFFAVCCLFFLLFSSIVHADEWLIADFPEPFERPSMTKMVEWIPEEVPRTVSLYFDTNDDGVYDLIVAYYLIEAYPCIKHCEFKITEYEDHWILVTDADFMPYSYYIIKKWALWRENEYSEWKFE